MAPTTTTLEHRISQLMSVRLLLIVPKDHATRLGALAEELADMPGEVIVDRRQSERRQADATWQGEDRRRNDRRSDRLERPDLRVLFVH